MALMQSRSLSEASQISGVPIRTLYSWLHEDTEFMNQYQQMKRESLQAVTDEISQKAVEAVQVLAEIMGDPEEKAGARVTSARTILDNYIKLTELTDIEQRLTAIEEKLK